MQDIPKRPEKPKILGPKPAIASKPKYVPPVNVKRPKDDLPVGSGSIYAQNFVYYSEKCDKFGKCEEKKTPGSPSTVCCSILSNVGNDCCGIIADTSQKEQNGKTMTKMESIDSNSSDSGGFKEFLQRDLARKAEPGHQRKISQPEFPDNEEKSHHRNSSDYMVQPKAFIPSAQALEHFLPKSEFRNDEPDYTRCYIAKLNVAQTSFLGKSEEQKPKPKPQLIPHSQFQQSTKKLEELFSQRFEKERVGRRGSNLGDGAAAPDFDQKLKAQKQFQEKLQADLNKTVKQIQEIQSTELRLPQNRKWTESNRSQPAIGLKHTPKTRVSAGLIVVFNVPLKCSIC